MKNSINVNNFKLVKVELMTSSKLFTSTMSSYFVAIHELDDKIKTFNKNIKSLEKIINQLDPNCENYQDRVDLLKKIKEKRLEYKEESKKRIAECYSFLNDSLYNAYCTSESDFKKALIDWFDGQSIKASKSLIAYMLKIVSYKSKTCRDGNVLAYKTKSQFNDSFMRGLAQLMLAKNALKPDLYKYESVNRLVESMPSEKTNEKVISEVDSTKNDDLSTINIKNIKEAFIEGEDESRKLTNDEICQYINLLVHDERIKLISQKGKIRYAKLDGDYLIKIILKKGCAL